MVFLSDANWVGVITRISSGKVWRLASVHLRTAEENGGQHNVFIWCMESGQVVRNGQLQIAWGWADQRTDEASPNKICDKRSPWPSTDVPIEDGQKIWCEVFDVRGYGSDRATNLHANFGGPGGGADWKHQSYDLYFVLTDGESGPTSPPPPTQPPPLSIFDRLDGLERRVLALETAGRVYG